MTRVIFQALILTEICDPGEYLTDTRCRQCDKDYYQPESMPKSTVQCTPCPDKGEAQQGTSQFGTSDVSECSRKFIQFTFWDKYRPRGYKTFFMLNSAEHEISTAHKNYNTDKWGRFLF